MAKQTLDTKDPFKGLSIDQEGFQSALRHAKAETFDLGHLFSGVHLQLKALISKVKLLFSLASDKSTPAEKIRFLLKSIHSLFRKLDGTISYEKRRKREVDEEWRENQEDRAQEYLIKDQLEFEKEMEQSKANHNFFYHRYLEFNFIEPTEPSFAPAFKLFKEMVGYLRPRPRPQVDTQLEQRESSLKAIYILKTIDF